MPLLTYVSPTWWLKGVLGQAVHVVDVPVEKVPQAQALHAARLVVPSWMPEPATHTSHAALPGADVLCPAGHGRQPGLAVVLAPASSPGPYVPTGHLAAGGSPGTLVAFAASAPQPGSTLQCCGEACLEPSPGT